MSAKENAYARAFKRHKGSIKSLMWKSYASASIRYKELIKDIDFNNKSILDVGCGFGDIIPFISSKSTSFEYTGIDLTEEFTREAEKRYPDYKFVE
ncbi:MAG: class I SAM-dependent methyltransferase [Candidatus Moranbacteria bacterium]|nr:class I SAM-dependent methyltransferase [Candidatus Moranbacteria bacterium]